jgi:hypothetical protein
MLILRSKERGALTEYNGLLMNQHRNLRLKLIKVQIVTIDVFAA